MRVRTGIPFAIAAIALGACSNRIVFEADDLPDDAGVTADVKTPPVKICRAAPYIAEAGIATSTGSLEMTLFPTGTGPITWLAPGPHGDLWFTAEIQDEPRGKNIVRATLDGVVTEV